MDDILQQALEFSNYNQTLNIQKKSSKEKLDLNLTYGYGGGLFKIDRPLIVFIKMLIDQGRTSNIVLLDFYNNPVLVEDLINFFEIIFDRYVSGISDYYLEYEKIKKNRSVKKLLDL